MHGSDENQDRTFRAIYSALTGRNPYLWQVRIGREIGQGGVPRNIVIPTGGGKTGILASWLTSWCMESLLGSRDITKCRIGRRMAWVVNRRTVVDDIGAEALRMAKRIQHGAWIARLPWGEQAADVGHHDDNMLSRIATGLNPLGGGAHPLAVSSLRGELVDAGDWRIDPARLGIIIGTPMMIGSKLLFRGVDDGRSRRSQSAGILGCDSIIVHDECHLEPAFDHMLDEIRNMASTQMDGLPGVFRPCALSATPPVFRRGDVFELNAEERAEDRIKKVVETRKMMRIVQLSERKEWLSSIVSAALGLGGHETDGQARRVLVFIRRPSDAQKVSEAIGKRVGKENVGLLTGTIRGHERDRLVHGDLFASFRTNPNRAPVESSIYLVATSAGEVGVDIDGDAAVMDACPLDSLGQRLGRVGRSGNRPNEDHIEIVSVWVKTTDQDEFSACTAKTLEIMCSRRHEGTDIVSVGPVEMTALSMGADASAATMQKASPRQIGENNWAGWRNTSVPPADGVITLDQHIMGQSNWEPAVTEVCWRADVSLLCGCGEDELVNMIERFPVRSAERLTANSKDVLKWMQARANYGANGCFISMRNGTMRVIDIASIMNGQELVEREAWKCISDCEIIVPTTWGGLSADGMLSEEKSDSNGNTDLDVAELGGQHRRQRVVVRLDEEGDESFSPLLGGSLQTGLRKGCSLPTEDGGRIEYMLEPSVQPSPVRVDLDKHLREVGDMCRSMASRMGADTHIVEVLATAGATHDLGKEDERWQRYARNVATSGNAIKPVAKSKSYLSPQVLEGFRHEAASVQHPDFIRSWGLLRSDEMRDLLMHIVAAHHGWGRPGFPPESGHEDISGQMNIFRTLECSVGIFQLPLLEAVLKCADTKVSLEESK